MDRWKKKGIVWWELTINGPAGTNWKRLKKCRISGSTPFSALSLKMRPLFPGSQIEFSLNGQPLAPNDTCNSAEATYGAIIECQLA